MMAGSWVSLTLLLAAFALGPLVVYVFKGQHEEAASSGAEGSSNPWLTMGPQGYLEEVALSLALLGLVYVFYLLSRAVTALIHFLEMLFVGAVLLGWCIACFWCAWGGAARACVRGGKPPTLLHRPSPLSPARCCHSLAQKTHRVWQDGLHASSVPDWVHVHYKEPLGPWHAPLFSAPQALGLGPLRCSGLSHTADRSAGSPRVTGKQQMQQQGD